MVKGRLANVLGKLRRSAQLCATGTMTGGQLLERFLYERDEAAFEALVRLHGPMVMGVCQRVLGNPHDAEDAFQATFLVLVRKAASIAPKELVGNWLYGVAYRTALKARTMTTRRRSREKQVAELPERETVSAEVWNDLQPLLDCELNALPEIYRVPVVLCELGGKTKRQVAEQLGVPEGTVSSRLARGRERLREGLARRGVTISGAGLAMVLTQNALQASVNSHVLGATVKACVSTMAGQAASGLISAKVAALTEGVLKTMFLTKLKTATAVVFFISLVAAGVGGLSQIRATEQPENRQELLLKRKKAPPADIQDRELQAELELARARLLQAEANLEAAIAQARAAQAALEALRARTQKPAQKLHGKIYFHKGHDLTAYDPQKKKFADLSKLEDEPNKHYQANSARLSPDGRLLAFMQAEAGTPAGKLQIRDVTKDDPPKVIVDMPGRELSSWSWSPDGKRISFAVWAGDAQKYYPHIVDVATQKVQKVTLPEMKTKGPEGFGSSIDAWSPDNLWLVFARGHFHLVNPKTKEVRRLTSEPTGFLAGTCRFSPDGKKILFIGSNKDEEYNLSVLDVFSGHTKMLAKLKDKWDFSACWSPDSRRIACSSVDVDEKMERSGPCRVEIYDAEGLGRPQLLFEDREGGFTVTAWR
jgi:RNA polymerase sigma factor (sigma-70 family)